MPDFTRESLIALKRAEVQALCKKHSLKANGTTAALIDSLLSLSKVNNSEIISEIPEVKVKSTRAITKGSDQPESEERPAKKLKQSINNSNSTPMIDAQSSESLLAKLKSMEEMMNSTVNRLEKELEKESEAARATVVTLMEASNRNYEELRKELSVKNEKLEESIQSLVDTQQELSKVQQELSASISERFEMMATENSDRAKAFMIQSATAPGSRSQQRQIESPPQNSTPAQLPPPVEEEFTQASPSSDAPPINSLNSFSSPASIVDRTPIVPGSPTQRRSPRKVSSSSNLNKQVFPSPDASLLSDTSQVSASAKRPRPSDLDESIEEEESVVESITQSSPAAFTAEASTSAAPSFQPSVSDPSFFATNSTFSLGSPEKSSKIATLPFPIVPFKPITPNISTEIIPKIGFSFSGSPDLSIESTSTFKSIDKPPPTPEASKTLFGTERTGRFGDFVDSPASGTSTVSNITSPAKIIARMGWGFGNR